MTSAQVVETSVKVIPNSPFQDYSHPDDHNLRTYDMTPGFKPFTVFQLYNLKLVLSPPDVIYGIIIQHIVTLPKYGHDELNIRRPHITDILRYT